jgi:hypothetical protein
MRIFNSFPLLPGRKKPKQSKNITFIVITIYLVCGGHHNPPVSDMVKPAVKTLNEHGGSSLQAIKKYLAANCKVDCDTLAPFIK